MASCKPLAELVNLFQEPVRLEDLVRKGGESKVEIVFNLGILKTAGLGDGGPDAGQVLDKGVAQVGQGCVADVIADDKEEKRPRLGSGGALVSAQTVRLQVAKSYCLSFRNSCKLTSKTVLSRPMLAP